MSLDRVGSTPAPHGTRMSVSLSPWVNEPLPPWHQILTAHDVARLTRRNRWMLTALTLIGRFPEKRRFRGRAVGWSRQDVDQWLGCRHAKVGRRSVVFPLLRLKVTHPSAQMCLFCRRPQALRTLRRARPLISRHRSLLPRRHGR
jgi:predicted DNA-binding transcriptional regulator AlpA